MLEAKKTFPLDWESPLTDLPVIGDIIDIVPTFVLGVKMIALHPESWIERLDLIDNPRLMKAVKFLTGSIILGYFLSIPALARWDIDEEQDLYVIHNVVAIVVGFGLLYAGLKVVGARGSPRTIMSVFFFTSGVVLPLYIICMLPTAFVAGPAVLGADAVPNAGMHDASGLTTTILQMLPGGLAGVLWVFAIQQLAPTFGISTARIAGGMLIGGIVALAFFVLVQARLFEVLDPALKALLKYF